MFPINNKYGILESHCITSTIKGCKKLSLVALAYYKLLGVGLSWLFHTQLLRYGIPCQSVVSWALSNQKSKHFFLSVLFSCNFIFVFHYYYSFIFLFIYLLYLLFHFFFVILIILRLLLLVLIVQHFGSLRERCYMCILLLLLLLLLNVIL